MGNAEKVFDFKEKDSYSDENAVKSLGMRIRIALSLKGLNQAELGKLMGITQAAVSKWLNGKTCPDALQIWKISQITQKPIEWFYKELD